MNLYDETLEVISLFDTYKSPNVDDWITKIDILLSEMHLSTIGSDHISNIYMDKNNLEITTEYSLRGCACSDDISIPIYILKADNYLLEGKKYYLSKMINENTFRYNSALKNLDSATNDLNKFKQLLTNLNEENTNA